MKKAMEVAGKAVWFSFTLSMAWWFGSAGNELLVSEGLLHPEGIYVHLNQIDPLYREIAIYATVFILIYLALRD